MHIITKKKNSSSQKTDKSFIYGAVIKWAGFFFLKDTEFH